MSRCLHCIWPDDRGNSVIELALILPVLTGLLMGTVDISRAVSAKLQVEQAAQRAIELVQRSDFQESDTATLKSDAALAADVSEDDVDVDAWLECDGTRQTNFDDVCSDSAVSAKYVQVTIEKSFTPMFGLDYFPGANADGTVTLSSTAGIRAQ